MARLSDLAAWTKGARPPRSQALRALCAGSDSWFYTYHVVWDLLSARAGVETRNKNGATPLLCAAATGLTDIRELLIRFGADKTP